MGKFCYYIAVLSTLFSKGHNSALNSELSPISQQQQWAGQAPNTEKLFIMNPNYAKTMHCVIQFNIILLAAV